MFSGAEKGVKLALHGFHLCPHKSELFLLRHRSQPALNLCGDLTCCAPARLMDPGALGVPNGTLSAPPAAVL